MTIRRSASYGPRDEALAHGRSATRAHARGVRHGEQQSAGKGHHEPPRRRRAFPHHCHSRNARRRSDICCGSRYRIRNVSKVAALDPARLHKPVVRRAECRRRAVRHALAVARHSRPHHASDEAEARGRDHEDFVPGARALERPAADHAGLGQRAAAGRAHRGEDARRSRLPPKRCRAGRRRDRTSPRPLQPTGLPALPSSVGSTPRRTARRRWRRGVRSASAGKRASTSPKLSSRRRGKRALTWAGSTRRLGSRSGHGNREAIAWQFVVTKNGATSVAAASVEATRQAKKMAPDWEWTSAGHGSRPGGSRCGGTGGSSGGSTGPSVQFVSICR